MQKNKSQSELLVYQASNWAIELKADINEETIWANQIQMSEIFWVNPQAISKHIQNIYKEWELEKKATSSKLELVQTEGNRRVTRQVNHYNLDILIAVGYRISSVTWTKFRQRATQTLRKHITQWYTINSNRIKYNYEAFLNAVEEVKQLDNKKTLWNELFLFHY